MKYFLKDKLTINESAEPYDNKEQLMLRLWGTKLDNFILIIVDRIDKPNLVCDFKAHGEMLWLSAFDDQTMQTVYDDAIPTGDDLDNLFILLEELEKK